MNLETYNLILAGLVLAAQIWFLFVLVSLIGSRGRVQKDPVLKWVSKYFLWIALAFSLAGFVGSLGYSEVIGYTPCKLCWIQRITLYPVLILTAVGLYKKQDTNLVECIIALMILGSLFGIYHLFLQFVPNSLDCATTGQGVSCSKNWVRVWGYITIPMMCLTAHLNILLAAITRRLDK